MLFRSDSGNIQLNPATTLDITASNTTLNGNLYVSNNVYIDSNTTLGDNSADKILFNSRINSSIEPQIDNFYTLGDSYRSWNLFTGRILLDEIEFNDNYIRTTASNLNLELKASGTGAVRVEKVDFNENVISTFAGNNLIINSASTLDITASTTNINGIMHTTEDTFFDSDITFGNSSSDNVI